MQIVKRDGTKQDFDVTKIENAIRKAADATQTRVDAIYVAQKVKLHIQDGFSVEQIQDIVESELMKAGHYETAKAYILYRQQRTKARDNAAFMAGLTEIVNGYLGGADWRVNENANSSFSLSGLNGYLAGSVTARYWLNNIYPENIAQAHVNGDLHLHDLSQLSDYCAGWDLHQLLRIGFGGVKGKTQSKPAKHLSTALGQIVNFVYTISGEIAGAVAFSSFDTLLAPFVRHDNLSYEQVKQLMQEFIFNMNIPTRQGFQNPFSNLTFDLVPSVNYRDQAVIIGGKVQDTTYSEYQAEMDIINRAFCEVMLEGDSTGAVFTFPIPTYNITRDFDWNNDNLETLWKMTAKYGIPYFCLDKDTKVRIFGGGTKRINDIDIGDVLLDESGKPTSVIFKNNTQTDKVVKIQLSSGRVISSTMNHRFLTDNGLKRSDSMSISDRLAKTILGSISFKKSGMNLSIDELKKSYDVFVINDNLISTVDPLSLSVGDNVLIKRKDENKSVPKIDFSRNKKGRDTNSQSINIPKHITKSICRLLGYLVGNGYYAKKNAFISFVNSEQSLLDDFSEILESLGVNVGISKAGHSEIAKNISTHSVELRDFLLYLGLERVTAKNKSVPSVIWQCPNDYIAEFIKGLFDTGGCVNKRRIIAFASVSRNLVEQVQLLLFRIGIASRVKKGKKSYLLNITGDNVSIYNEKIGSLCVMKKDRLQKHSILTNRLSFGFMNTKKANALFCESVPSILESRDCLYDIVDGFNNTTIEYEDISSISIEKGSFDVVDITLDSEGHLFQLEEGIVSHNSNYVNSELKPEDATSMCCRLRVDRTEIQKRSGGLFASVPMTGSIAVVTLNLPRLGYVSKDRDEFYDKLSALMDLARDSLEIKRKTLERLTENGLYPYCAYYLKDVKARNGSYWSNHFSTIGLVGMHECCVNLLGVGIETQEGQEFAQEVLNVMRNRVLQYQKETGNLYNLEATPAEGTSYRLAKIDAAKYPYSYVSGNDAPYYTNSTQLPVNYTDDMFEMLEHQEPLQILYTGGTVAHLFLGEQIDDWRQARNLVKLITSMYRIPYISLTPTFSVCEEHGYLSGKQEICPYCGAQCQVYSRVVGYLAPVSSWNIGKKEEMKDRKTYAYRN